MNLMQRNVKQQKQVHTINVITIKMVNSLTQKTLF